MLLAVFQSAVWHRPVAAFAQEFDVSQNFKWAVTPPCDVLGQAS